MIQEQAAAAVIFPLISEKNKSREKGKKEKSVWNLGLKEKKNLESYETLLAELCLDDEHNYNILLRMTSENFEEISQLVKDDITKENIRMRELIPPKLAATIGFLSTGELYKSYIYEYYSSYSTMNSSTFTSFLAFVFSIFSSLIKNTNKSHDLSSIH